MSATCNIFRIARLRGAEVSYSWWAWIAFIWWSTMVSMCNNRVAELQSRVSTRFRYRPGAFAAIGE
jgi:hypothetical protein